MCKDIPVRTKVVTNGHCHPLSYVALINKSFIHFTRDKMNFFIYQSKACKLKRFTNLKISQLAIKLQNICCHQK